MSADAKRNLIVEAARKRFAHFGVAKTTMNEIVDDLSYSKASLYYYFPDKLNLYAAVLEKIIMESEINSDAFLQSKTVEAAVNQYIDIRFEFFNKNYNILEYLPSVNTTSKELAHIFNQVRNRQIALISGILEKGVKEKTLQIEDIKKTTSLFLDCLEGLHLKALSENNSFFPDKKVFTALWKREKEFAEIFLRGLKC